MPSAPAIETSALTKHFGAVVALDGLDLTVQEGEVFGWIGPNGAGKTTTVRLLLDFLRPTSGALRVLGGSGRDPSVRRRIGYLPGDLRLPDAYTAADVFEYYGALRGGVDQAWVAELTSRFELDPSRRIRQLSTGNRRKVGIIQAFIHRPELLLLDEPTSGLDPLLQQEFHRLVRETAARGATVFLSSHVLPEVEALASRVGILRTGQLVAVAGLDELRRRARQRLTITVDGPADAGVFDELEEVVEATAHADAVDLVVEGSADRVVKAAARLNVLRIVSHESDLEDVFLSFYSGGAGP